MDLRYHVCQRENAWCLYDARGIFCCYVCDQCEATKRSRYRADIFTDANYWADEDIDS